MCVGYDDIYQVCISIERIESDFLEDLGLCLLGFWH